MDIRSLSAKEFGAKLRSLMQERGISASRLAEQLSMNRSTFSKYFSGVSSPKTDTLISLCKILNVDLNYFFHVSDKGYQDYEEDVSKSRERKVIESIFCLTRFGLIIKSHDYGREEFVINESRPLELTRIMNECLTYANSAFVESENISKKIADAYEGVLAEALVSYRDDPFF